MWWWGFCTGWTLCWGYNVFFVEIQLLFCAISQICIVLGSARLLPLFRTRDVPYQHFTLISFSHVKLPPRGIEIGANLQALAAVFFSRNLAKMQCIKAL